MGYKKVKFRNFCHISLMLCIGIYLRPTITEAKHTKTDNLPSFDDIKDGLLKMILFTNLEGVKIGEITYNPVPVLKLTTGSGFNIESLNDSKKELLFILRREAKINGFRILINDDFFA